MSTQIKGNDTSTFGGNVDVTGNVITDAPAFSAYMSANQTQSHNVFTKVQFNTEQYDTNSCYDNATNYRFTPTTAGYYCIKSVLSYLTPSTGSSDVYYRNVIYKNGSGFVETELASSNYGNGRRLTVSTISDIYMNGSTDYLEVYSYHYDYSTGAATTIVADLGGPKKSLFQGTLVRAV